MKKDPATYGFLWINKGDTFVLGTDNAFYAKAFAYCERGFKSTVRSKWSRFDEDMANDLFLESVEAMWANQRNGRLISLTNCTVFSYLLTIGLRNAGKVKFVPRLDDRHFNEPTFDLDVLEAETMKCLRMQCVNDALERLRKKDRELVLFHHVERVSMKDLAAILGYSSANSAKKAKCLALGKVREQLRKRWSDEDVWGPLAA